MDVARGKPPDSQLLHCERHGLRYDPALHTGCVVCRRGAAPRAAAQAPRRALLGVLLLACVLLVGLTAGVRSLHRQLRSTQESAGPALRALFVGNSLTQRNDLPALVAGLAKAGNDRRLEPVRDSPGGWGLLEHVASGRTRQRLAAEHWDVLVLQDQSQRPSFAPEQVERDFALPARTLAGFARAAGTRVLFYDTFAHRNGDRSHPPSDSYAAMQARIDQSYAAIAAELGADVVPVGPLWRDLRATHPELELWDGDGVHPNRAGSYLAACAFYAAIYGRSPEGNSFLADLPPAQAELLQRAAATSVRAGSSTAARAH
jgi:hypothetical protein